MEEFSQDLRGGGGTRQLTVKVLLKMVDKNHVDIWTSYLSEEIM